jgi:hypothetical protein
MSPRFLTLGLVVAAALLAQAGAHAAVSPVRPAPAASAPAAEALAQEAPLSRPGAQPGTPQRSKMKSCNADARTKDLHGDERRKFMSHCLSGKPAAHS